MHNSHVIFIFIVGVDSKIVMRCASVIPFSPCACSLLNLEKCQFAVHNCVCYLFLSL